MTCINGTTTKRGLSLGTCIIQLQAIYRGIEKKGEWEIYARNTLGWKISQVRKEYPHHFFKSSSTQCCVFLLPYSPKLLMFLFNEEILSLFPVVHEIS
jgi:hypothetical protein